jgi:hypothetical protein
LIDLSTEERKKKTKFNPIFALRTKNSSL